MRFFTRLAILFYVTTISIVCGLAVLFVLHVFLWQDVYYLLNLSYMDLQARVVVGLSAIALILLSFLFARIIIGRQQKERTIAFDNPAGRVSISLTAMEDLVRRVVVKFPEVKEIKPNIIATKKGLDVSIRMVLKSDANIPEMTSELQETVKNKIQDTVGLDGTVVVKIHVIKIATEEEKFKRDKGRDSIREKSDPSVPFPGYRP